MVNYFPLLRDSHSSMLLSAAVHKTTHATPRILQRPLLLPVLWLLCSTPAAWLLCTPTFSSVSPAWLFTSPWQPLTSWALPLCPSPATTTSLPMACLTSTFAHPSKRLVRHLAPRTAALLLLLSQPRVSLAKLLFPGSDFSPLKVRLTTSRRSTEPQLPVVALLPHARAWLLNSRSNMRHCKWFLPMRVYCAVTNMDIRYWFWAGKVDEDKA